MQSMGTKAPGVKYKRMTPTKTKELEARKQKCRVMALKKVLRQNKNNHKVSAMTRPYNVIPRKAEKALKKNAMEKVRVNQL